MKHVFILIAGFSKISLSANSYRVHRFGGSMGREIVAVEMRRP